VRPSLSILLTCYGELFSDDHLLPAGRLREPLGGASRADITVVTKTPYGVGGLGDLFYTSIRYGQLRPLFPEFFVDRETGLERLRDLGVSLLLVTGISDPSYVVEYLRDLGLEFSCMHFPDHHRFTKRDIDDVVDNFDLLAGPDRLLVTTEKDGSRLLDCPYLPDALKPYILELPIGLTFFSADREELFIQKIKNHVEGFKRDGIVVTSAGTG
jgi:tetraacyldisaccharide 4'-kinase